MDHSQMEVSMRNKKLRSGICVFLAVLLLFTLVMGAIGSIGAAAVDQSDIDALERQKEEITAQKNSVSVQIAELQQKQATVLEQKAALDEQNELTRQQIELITEQIELYDDLIAEKEQELEEAIDREEYQKERFEERVRAMEENGSMSYVAFALQATSFTDLISRIDNISDIMESDKALEEKYIEARETVETVKAEYEETQEAQIEKRGELEEQRSELEAQIAEAEALVADLESDIAEYTEQYAANEAAEQELQNQIDQMTAEFNRQQDELDQQGQQVTTGTGSFINPLSGSHYITSAFGWRIHPIFQTEKYHSGIDIAADSGTPIYATDDGTVQTAVYSSSYGNYVVINHGNGYTTLYAHMSSMAVSAGQTVSQGDVIGYVGSTGWSTGPHLHYEVTLNGTRQNPENYVSGYTPAY